VLCWSRSRASPGLGYPPVRFSLAGSARARLSLILSLYFYRLLERRHRRDDVAAAVLAGGRSLSIAQCALVPDILAAGQREARNTLGLVWLCGLSLGCTPRDLHRSVRLAARRCRCGITCSHVLAVDAGGRWHPLAVGSHALRSRRRQFFAADPTRETLRGNGSVTTFHGTPPCGALRAWDRLQRDGGAAAGHRNRSRFGARSRSGRGTPSQRACSSTGPSCHAGVRTSANPGRTKQTY
jgi:hypothetical protein